MEMVSSVGLQGQSLVVAQLLTIVMDSGPFRHDEVTDLSLPKKKENIFSTNQLLLGFYTTIS